MIDAPLPLTLKKSTFLVPMRDLLVHLAWIGTHFARTLWDDNPSQRWLASLTSEIEVLQAELHRTQRILNGYGSLLERCERGQRYQVWGNTCFFIIILLLTATLFASWCKLRRTAPIPRLTAGDSPSSDELGSSEQPRGLQQTGPCRPSTFRGKRWTMMEWH